MKPPANCSMWLVRHTTDGFLAKQAIELLRTNASPKRWRKSIWKVQTKVIGVSMTTCGTIITFMSMTREYCASAAQWISSLQSSTITTVALGRRIIRSISQKICSTVSSTPQNQTGSGLPTLRNSSGTKVLQYTRSISAPF